MSTRCFLSLFSLLLILFSSCKKQDDDERNYIFLGHTYDWNIPSDDKIDPRIAALQLDTFDQVWLGGDICARTTRYPATLNYLDSLFNLGSPQTHWTLGNHDISQGNLNYIHAKTKRPAAYSASFDNLCLLVLNTNIFYHPKYKPTPAQCAEKEKQFELIKNISDTISESSHLIVLHHYCLLTNEQYKSELQLDKIFHYHHPELFVSCEAPNTFESAFYPYFQKIQEKGTQVVFISGDIGQRAKSFEYTTEEGIVFLGSGINNSCGKPTAPSYVTSFAPDKILFLKYKMPEEQLSWHFVELNSLIKN